MTVISDLPLDLVEDILIRVPITCLGAVRSTCKPWNDLSKDKILCRAEARQQFLGFMIKDLRVCSVRFDVPNYKEAYIKEIGDVLDEVEISKVLHCDGLLLCVPRDNSSLVVWNPYLGQTKYIQPLKAYTKQDRYAIGCDKNRNHKILRFFKEFVPEVRRLIVETQVYDLSSNSWRLVDITPEWNIHPIQRGVSLKGNTYFIATQDITYQQGFPPLPDENCDSFLLCFDFTTERFGPRLRLPFSHFYIQTAALSSLRDEKLAALFKDEGTLLEIWVTTMIEPDAVSWIPFSRVVSNPPGCRCFHFVDDAASFFVDPEKKVAVVFHIQICYRKAKAKMRRNQPLETGSNTAYIIGEHKYLRILHLGEAVYGPLFNRQKGEYPLVCSASSYVPSLVQINKTKKRKRKQTNKL